MTKRLDAGESPGLVRRGRRRRALVALAAVGAVVMLVMLSVWIGPRLQSPQQAAANAAPPAPSLVTVAAERRVLAEAIVLRAKVMPGPSLRLTPHASAVGADSVVTKVKVRAGKPLNEGDLVLEWSGKPMVAMVLPFPLYRDLTGGMSGPDVVEVQRALRRLGYRAPTHGRLDEATQAALARLWKNHGYQVPPGDAAALTAAQTAYDEAVAAGDGVTSAKERLAKAELAAGPSLLRSTVLRLTRSGLRIKTVRVRVGSVLNKPDAPVVELDGGSAYLMAVVTKEQAGLLRAGQKATVLDEISGERTRAVVKKVAAEVTTDEQSGATGFAVTLAFAAEPIGAPDRSVRVDIASSSSAEPVLAVPVTAVYSRPDGSTFVTVASPAGEVSDVTVTAGQTGGGWVAITPVPADAVTAGTSVVVGRT